VLSTASVPKGTTTYCAVPTRAVENRPKVEKEHGRDTPRGELGRGVKLWFGDGNVCTQVIHAYSTPDGSGEEHRSTAKSVDQEEKPNDCAQELDDTENTGREQRGVGTGNSNGLEDSLHNRHSFSQMLRVERERNATYRRVVVDSVNTGSVLASEQHHCNTQSSHVSLGLEKSLDRSSETSASHGSVSLQRVLNVGHFGEQVRVFSIEASNSSKILDGKAISILGSD
jgi:hypothetical protein